jgi:preprotein translocase subunit YajC
LRIFSLALASSSFSIVARELGYEARNARKAKRRCWRKAAFGAGEVEKFYITSMKNIILITLLPVFAIAQDAPSPQSPSMFGAFLPFLLMFVVMYIFFIMPKQKENKKIEQMRTALKKGDKVLTVAGIIGTVTHVDDRFVNIKTGDTKIDFEKVSVIKLLEADTEKREAESK